ncbi:LysR family transcriptional regulator [Pseudohoeflea coraliihabitans]|uniref:LysR family transcriptional regulator n=1 Tax=Pseudohoeflea coraliihabitans TaxID=2860393 RepID=UPI00210791AE|nr:LysR family transcriptional regulator [Pseudohoeflea sp. DP4N28-3]
MNEPSIRQIRYFIAVANEGQISRAAMELNVSQSAMTTAIKQLEEIVGVALFTRHPGGVALTYEGHIFLDHARRVMASMAEAVRSPRRLRDDVQGSLRLAVTYTVAGYFIPPYLERFARAFPGVTLQLTEAPRNAIEDGLVSGTFDLAVMLTSNIVDQEGIAYVPLLQSRRRLWLSSQHPLLDHTSVGLSEVANEPYIMLTVDEASNTAQRYWNRTSYRPKTIFRTSSVESVRSLVANGMGVTILSDMVYRPWSLDGRRVEVMALSDPVPTMEVGLAWAANVEQSVAAKVFQEFMQAGHDSAPHREWSAGRRPNEGVPF